MTERLKDSKTLVYDLWSVQSFKLREAPFLKRIKGICAV